MRPLFTGEFHMTAEPVFDAQILDADVIGLTKIAPLSRRGFMTASAAVAAGYTLAAGPVRADVIKTDPSGLDAGDIKIKVADGEMPGYFARPKGVANPPVVIVAMEIFGLHEYIKDVTRRLAKLGAFAIAPDYYFRKGTDLTKITEMSQLLPLVNSKPDAELLTDLDSTVAFAKAQGGNTDRLGMIGFCRGGRNVWEYAAHSSALKAAVAFYGPLVDAPNPVWPKSPTQLAPEMKAPVLGLYGEADTGILVPQVEAMKAALAAAGKTAEFKIYPGAPHGFHADYRPSYRQDAAEGLADQVQGTGLISGNTFT
jgi:carboxymethylenebutenolidase